jgi:hypothetical protein
MQLLALAVTLCISITSGALCGWITSKVCSPVKELFDDMDHWEDVKDRTTNVLSSSALTLKMNEIEEDEQPVKGPNIGTDNGI